RYAAFSSCFRREAGAAGKDTRGIFRVHQFDKVEMYSFVAPERSAEEHERLLSIEEELLGELGIPYRVVNIAVDDLGASAAKKYDLEAWLPGQGRYRELTSCSNTTDFQARRLEIRMRPAEGRPVVLHTLNGTAVALVQTSTSEPLRRVSRRSPLSSTLSPVESMNSTRVKSRTSCVLPSAMAALRRSEKRGAVLTWISPAASRMRVRSPTSSSETSNFGCGKSFIRQNLLSPDGRRQSFLTGV